MPIIAERLHSLLAEHESVLRTMRELYVNGKQIARQTQQPAEQRLARIDDLLDSIANPPDTFALIERANYNRNAKQNLRQREKQRRKRRALGIPERPLFRVGSYTQIAADSGNASDLALTPAERAQLEQLQAHRAEPLVAPDEQATDARLLRCRDFFLKNESATRAAFTEFCVTNGLDEPIDYFLDDLIAQGLIERRENGTYATIRTGPPVEDVVEF